MNAGISHTEVFILEKCERRKDPAPVFATFDEVFAIEEMNRLMGSRTCVCFYRVTAVPIKEKE